MATIDFLPRKLQTAFSRMGAPESLKALIALHGNPEYIGYWDDFLGDEIPTHFPANGGTGTQVVGMTAAPGGTMTLTTQGNQAADSAIVSGPGLHWNGDLGFYFITRFKVDSLTELKFFVGVTDEQTDAGPINSKASATFHVSDLAGISYDAADDTNTTFQTNGGTSDANVDTDFTLVADTYLILEMVARDNNVTCFINGQQRASGLIEGGVAMMPVWSVTQNGTTAKTLTADYVGIIGPRF